MVNPAKTTRDRLAIGRGSSVLHETVRVLIRGPGNRRARIRNVPRSNRRERRGGGVGAPDAVGPDRIPNIGGVQRRAPITNAPVAPHRYRVGIAFQGVDKLGDLGAGGIPTLRDRGQRLDRVAPGARQGILPVAPFVIHPGDHVGWGHPQFNPVALRHDRVAIIAKLLIGKRAVDADNRHGRMGQKLIGPTGANARTKIHRHRAVIGHTFPFNLRVNHEPIRPEIKHVIRHPFFPRDIRPVGTGIAKYLKPGIVSRRDRGAVELDAAIGGIQTAAFARLDDHIRHALALFIRHQARQTAMLRGSVAQDVYPVPLAEIPRVNVPIPNLGFDARNRATQHQQGCRRPCKRP